MTSSLFAVTTKHFKLGMIRQPAGVIIAGEGTAYPGFDPIGGNNPPSMILKDGTGFWSGYASALVGGVCNYKDGLYDSYLVPYKAPTVPMWPGVQELREKIVAFLLWYAPLFKRLYGVYPPIIFTGYSQGSMGIDQVWVLDILAANGRLNFLKDFVYRLYQFGHIFRGPGNAKGNALAGLPESIKQDGVETGGIGCSMDLTVEQTSMLAPDGKPIVTSCANKGDIYTCCSVGTDPWNKPAPEGKVGNIFEQIIMKPSLSSMVSTLKVLGEPVQGIFELLHTMKFFAEGPNAPHYQYYPQMVACIADCIQLGESLPHLVAV